MQVESYGHEGDDWRQVAREHVFPKLEARMPAMNAAHEHLLDLCQPLWRRAQAALELDFPLAVVIYVGIGCGAGWAARYQGDPAVLFGLENVAEEGWEARSTLEGLLAHEIGHLAHFHWRDAAGIAPGEGSLWQLYTEGFAQFCEHRILGRESWHMSAAYDGVWLDWCRGNQGWLASEFLRTVDTGASPRPFFGSWYQLRGYKQTGYFLGHELVKSLVVGSNLRQVALLEDVEGVMREALERLASG